MVPGEGHCLCRTVAAAVLARSAGGTPVAVKLVRDQPVEDNVSSSLANELRVLRHIRHPNVVLFHGACVDLGNGVLALVLERVGGVTLGDCILPPKSPSRADRHAVILDVCCALRYLHSLTPAVAHGDLKPSNIMVEERPWGPRAKLLDSGLSRVMTCHARPLGGAYAWMAPEVLREACAPAASAIIARSAGGGIEVEILRSIDDSDLKGVARIPRKGGGAQNTFY